jgi:hypothetical protein
LVFYIPLNILTIFCNCDMVLTSDFHFHIILQWKCCDVHVKEFDEFMSIPPCTKGWHNADPESWLVKIPIKKFSICSRCFLLSKWKRCCWLIN